MAMRICACKQLHALNEVLLLNNLLYVHDPGVIHAHPMAVGAKE